MKLLLYLLAFTPLAFSRVAVYPHISGKVMFIRGLVALAAAWFFLRLVLDKPFGQKMAERGKALARNPVFLAVFAYFFFLVLSAALAVDKFKAFFGTFERGEGAVGLLFFFGFFLFSVFLFDKKDWQWFFRLTLLAAVVIFVHTFIQFLRGAERPYSFLGNPIYLAAYFLFPIFAAGIVYFSPRNYFWRAAAIFTGLTSFLGIFIANSRGVIVGCVAGVLASAGYLGFYIPRWRRPALFVLFFIVIFGGIFFASRNSGVWENVPGLGRLAQISSADDAASARLHNVKTALLVVNPAKEGFRKLLFGWGPENYLIAANKYYDPTFYPISLNMEDRVHNQVLDILVASGLFGVLAYLAVWFFVFRFILRAGREPFWRLALLFFAVAYFIQSMFVFDSLSVSLAVYVFLGFAIALQTTEEKYGAA
ncbi:MAG: O-antigen ligase family protein [Candidatus Doudnabacteria bacterium]|nr:O-antigen ligase family protein [Candidatus Doudnabacteria bacterium]